MWEDAPDDRSLDVGLGLLDKRYVRHAGVGLFLHVHGRPGALARLINRGVLGDSNRSFFRVSEEVRAKGSSATSRDQPSYEALMQAREILFGSPWALDLLRRGGMPRAVCGWRLPTYGTA